MREFHAFLMDFYRDWLPLRQRQYLGSSCKYLHHNKLRWNYPRLYSQAQVVLIIGQAARKRCGLL